MNNDHQYQDIRDGVRAVCAGFTAEYHRKVDAERAYPEDYGGSSSPSPEPP